MSSDVIIIIHDGGALGDGGGAPTPPPFPTGAFEVYADQPGSITSASGLVSAWGLLTQATPSARPVLFTDTVTAQTCIAISPGQSLELSDGTADFLSQEASVVIVVWRSRKWDPRLVSKLIYTTDGAATPGWQFQIADNSQNNGQYRKTKIRVYDGASFVIDEPPTTGFYNNAFIEGKWVISVLQTSATLATASVDDETAYSFVETATLPGGTPAPLIVGGEGYYDLAAIYAQRASAITPTQIAAAIVSLAARFNVDLLVSVIGSPTTVAYYAFPGLTKLDSGTLVTCYRAGIGHSGDVGVIDLKRSVNNGASWGTAQTIQSDPTLDSRDPSLTAKLQDGSYLCNFFLQTIGPNGLETSWVIKSTDDTATWGAPVQVTVGNTITSTGFEACSAPIVQRANGNLYFPLYGKSDGEAHTSAWAVLSTDAGATWPTNVKFADGVADGISYSEPGFCVIHTAHQGLAVGDILALVRDDTAGNQMWEFKRDGTTGVWTNLGAVVGAHSAGRSLTQLASGEIVWCGRPIDPAAALMRRTGTATWAVGQDTGATVLGVIDSAMTYAGLVETSAGIMTIVYGREHSATSPPIADIVCRPNFPEWQLFAEMPMTVTPTSQSVVGGETVQIVAHGALPFTYPFDSTGSGSPTVSASGLYTAGGATGTDIVNVTDVNGQIVPITFTVSGSSVTDPTGIDPSNLVAWWDPTQGITNTPFSPPNIGTWTSADANNIALTAAASVSDVPVTGTSLNGKASVDFDGTSGYFTKAIFIQDLVGTASWTIGFPFKDAGSIADTGLDFFNAAVLASVSDGYFSLGTTATQVYAGQDNAGAGTPYDIVAASAATAHYAVVQFDSATNEIAISIDGGSFSAGTVVSPLGVSATSINVGKSGVAAAHFKGALGDLAIWKSKLAGADLAALMTFLASRI